jgi:hypothetical protein
MLCSVGSFIWSRANLRKVSHIGTDLLAEMREIALILVVIAWLKCGDWVVEVDALSRVFGRG